MFLSPSDALAVLEHYHYWLIFPIAIFEGPIIIVISGFLVSLKILNPFVAYAILVLGDTVGDTLYYLVGRFWFRGGWVKKVGRFLGYAEEDEDFLESHFRRHKIKTFILAKMSHGIGGSVQVASGIARFPYFEFIYLNLMGTIPKTLILMTLGFYLGASYNKIDSYLDYIAVGVISVFVIVFLSIFSKIIVKNYFGKNK